MSGKFASYWSDVYLGGGQLYALARIENEDFAELSFHQWDKELVRVKLDHKQAVKLKDYLSKFYNQELSSKSQRKIDNTLSAMSTIAHSTPVVKLTLSAEDGHKISTVDLYSDDVLKLLSYLEKFLSE